MSKYPNCFVAKMPMEKKNHLKEALIEKGLEFSKPAYTVFSAKKKGLSCTLYESGKLTVQGKDKEDFIEFFLEPEILESFSSAEEVCIDRQSRIGIDESGKGDFFGPLCVAGLFVAETDFDELLAMGVKDSKSLNDKQIKDIAKKIKARFEYQLICIGPKKYNELYPKFQNLNRLLAWGHASAIKVLVEKTKCKRAYVDKFANESLVKNALPKDMSIELKQFHKAESDPVVAGASILARAAFVFAIEDLEKKYALSLPKGCSKKTVEAAKLFVKEKGPERLKEVSKTHFKTTEEVLASFGKF